MPAKSYLIISMFKSMNYSNLPFHHYFLESLIRKEFGPFHLERLYTNASENNSFGINFVSDRNKQKNTNNIYFGFYTKYY